MRTLVLLVMAPVSGCLCGDLFDDLPDGGAAVGGGVAGSGRVSGTVTPFRGADSVRLHPTPIDPALKRVGLAALNAGRARAPNQPVSSRRIVDTAVPLGTSGVLHGTHQTREVIAGELIVRFDERLSATDALKRVAPAGVTVRHAGFASQFLHLLQFTRVDGRPLSVGETRELEQQVERLPGVRFAELNGIKQALRAPNDSLYSAMWHLVPINMPAAWELERGETPVTVAVIDTGIISHPDLAGRVVAGADLIADANRALDGDGRDSDATDPGGDQPNGGSSWHGSHCAGTIGAATDNGAGIAGVNWNARIVPVRVLGKGGGTDFDITAGMVWASGGSVPGMPANANPAQVISMSLGGPGDPSEAYQDAIDSASSRGVTFVVAAGNDAVDASGFSPCNQTGVLCIGATRFNGTRASYSNFGQRIDLMAPGGEVAEDANGDGNPDGVLSTVKNDATGMATYTFEQGTSMATPHIAGVVSLLKARNPALTFTQVRDILVQTANTASRCNEGCGAGLVNVHAALLRATGTQPMGPARLSMSATELSFTSAATSQGLGLTNLGGMPLTVTLTTGGAQGSRVRFNPSSLTIAAGQTGQLQVSADLMGLAENVTHAATISVASNGGSASVGVKLRPGAISGRPVAVALIHLVNDEWKVADAVEAQSPSGFSYTLNAPAGTYFIFGAQDANGNNQFDEGEPIGLWPNTDSPKEVVVAAGANLTARNFVVSPQVNLNGNEARIIGTPCTGDAMCTGGFCATTFTDGYCTQDCSTTACPAGAKCLSGSSLSICLDTCSSPRGGRSTCRASYVCEDDGASGGLCIPNCNTITDFCDAPQRCSASTGYCE